VLIVLNALVLALLLADLRRALARIYTPGQLWQTGILTLGGGMLAPLGLVLIGGGPLLLLAVVLLLLGSLAIRYVIVRLPHALTDRPRGDGGAHDER
jgi:hypothetical protein